MVNSYQRQILLTVICTGLVTQGVSAADFLSEQDYLQELPVVLTASRLLQPLPDAPSAVTVIDRAMIVASGFRKIPDLFKLVPGMYVSYYRGSEAIVSYHGTSDQYTRRMQVLVDGRSIYLPPISAVDWEALPIALDDIERIEVVRGPSAAAHGANSLQGVINIITRDSAALSGTSVSSVRGSKGVSDVSARMGRHGEKLDYRLTMAYRAENGYDPRLDLPLSDKINHDSSATRLLNFRANYHPNYADSFDVQAGISSSMRGAGFTDSLLNQPHDQLASENFQQLTWLRALGDHDELQLRYSHTLLKSEDTRLTRPPPSSLPKQYQLSDHFLSDRSELELQHTVRLGDVNRLVWGAAYATDFGESANYFLTPLRSHESRLFVHDEWRMTPAWLLNTGVMLEKSSIGGAGSSPHIALNYHVTPAHTVRTSVSRAYRNPSMAEEKINWRYQLDVGTFQLIEAAGGLRPERVLSREVGYLGRLADYDTSIDLRIFHDRYTDIIVYSGASGFSNTPSIVDQNGEEVSIEYHVAERTRVTFNYSRNHISTTLAGYQGNMPEEQLGVMYEQRFDDNSFSLNYYQQSDSLPQDRGPTDFQSQHHRTDLRLAKSFKIAEKTISGDAALVIQNLFNNDYTEYIATNVFNRRGHVKLTVNF